MQPQDPSAPRPSGAKPLPPPPSAQPWPPPPGGTQPRPPPIPAGSAPPPPTGSARARAGPSGRWYAIPAGLVVAGVLLVAVVIVAMRSSLETAGDGDTIGPGETGVPVRLVDGYLYQLFRQSGPPPTSRSTCKVASKAGVTGAPVTLGDASKDYRDERVASNGKEYEFLGDFVAPRSGQATVSCTGQAGTLLVRPDDKPFVMLGLAVLVAVVLGSIALIVFVVLLVIRSRRSRAARDQLLHPRPYSPY